MEIIEEDFYLGREVQYWIVFKLFFLIINIMDETHYGYNYFSMMTLKESWEWWKLV